MSEAELASLLQRNPKLKIKDIRRKAREAPTTTKPQKPMFDSTLEEQYYNQRVYPLLLDGTIKHCDLHRSFEVVEAIEHGGKKYKNRVYTPDFILEFADGHVEVVETKGKRIKKLQRDYPLRRQLFILKFCIPFGWMFKEVMTGEI